MDNKFATLHLDIYAHPHSVIFFSLTVQHKEIHQLDHHKLRYSCYIKKWRKLRI